MKIFNTAKNLFRSALDMTRGASPLQQLRPPAPAQAIMPQPIPRAVSSFTPRTPNNAGLARAIASQVRVPVKQFTLDDVFGEQDRNIARQNIASRVGRVINPLLEKGNQTINTDFSQRGLFRSGLRNQGLTEFGDDIAEQRRTQEEELYNIRLAEAMEALKQRQLEAEREAGLVSGTVNFRDYI